MKGTTAALVALRILLGGLFFWSGFLKLLEPWQNFQVVIEAYQVLSGDPVRWAAQCVPWLEALGGLFLLTGLYARPAVYLLWGLNTVFLAALAQAVVRKLPIRECGCFGDAFSIPLPMMLTLDTALWFGFGAVILWAQESSMASLDRYFSKNTKRGQKR